MDAWTRWMQDGLRPDDERLDELVDLGCADAHRARADELRRAAIVDASVVLEAARHLLRTGDVDEALTLAHELGMQLLGSGGAPELPALMRSVLAVAFAVVDDELFDRPTVAPLLTLVARTSTVVDPDAAFDAWLLRAEHARRAGDARDQAWALFEAHRLGDAAGSEAALAQLEQLGSGAAGWEHRAAAERAVMADEPESVVLDHERAALDAGIRRGDRELEAAALLATSSSLVREGENRAAIDGMRRSIALASRCGALRIELVGRSNLVLALLDELDLDAAVSNARLHVGWLEQHGFDGQLADARALLALALVRAGRIPDAIELARDLLPARIDPDASGDDCWRAARAAEVLVECAPAAEAQAAATTIDDAAEVFASFGLDDDHALVVGTAAARFGDADRAVELLATQDKAEPMLIAQLVQAIVRGDGRALELDHVHGVGRLAGSLSHGRTSVRARLVADEVEAVTSALTRRDHQPLLAIARRWAHRGCRLDEVRARLLAARVALQAGTEGVAGRLARDVHDAARAIGSEHDADLALALLDDAVARTRRGGRTTHVASIAAAPAFQGIAATTHEQLARIARPTIVAAGAELDLELFVGDEDRSAAVVLVTSGWLRLVAVESEGTGGDERRYLHDLVGPGALLGSPWSSTDDTMPWNVEADGPVQLLELPVPDLLELAQHDHEFATALARSVAVRAERDAVLVRRLALLDIDSRVASALLDRFERMPCEVDGDGTSWLQRRVSQQELAAHVGASRATVNRILGELRDGGVVEQRGRALGIRNLDALRLAASGTRS